MLCQPDIFKLLRVVLPTSANVGPSYVVVGQPNQMLICWPNVGTSSAKPPVKLTCKLNRLLQLFIKLFLIFLHFGLKLYHCQQYETVFLITPKVEFANHSLRWPNVRYGWISQRGPPNHLFVGPTAIMPTDHFPHMPTIIQRWANDLCYWGFKKSTIPVRVV